MKWIIVLVILAMIWLWIIITRRTRISLVRQLGEGAMEFSLYSKTARLIVQALVALALLVPLAAVAFGKVKDVQIEDLLLGVVRGLWFASVAYGLSGQRRLLLGPRGFVQGEPKVIPWKDVVELRWDDDIGQHRWGVTITIRRSKGVEKRRIYLLRQQRETAERSINAFREIAPRAVPDAVQTL